MHSSSTPVLRFMDRFVDPILLLLAVASIPVVIVETGPTSAADDVLLSRVGWVVWAAFTANFIIRVAVARDRRTEARYLAWDLLIIVAQPVSAILGAGSRGGAPIVRLVVVLQRAFSRGAMLRRGWDAARRSPLKLALGFTPVLWLTSSAIVYRIEVANDGSIESIGDALWWGAATLTTVGYGDVSPSTSAARGVAILTMLGGISLFSVVTASLADSFVASRLGRRDRPITDSEHVVILGSSAKFDTLVQSLCAAADARHEVASIVAMAEEPKSHLTANAARALTRRGHRIDIRTGETSDPDQLATLGAREARAVLLISDSPEDDSTTIRRLLALSQLAVGEESSVPVLAEMHEHGRVREMQSVAGSRVTILDTPRFLSRAAARACRAPGALTAYQTLLSAEGPSLQRVPDAARSEIVSASVISATTSSTPTGSDLAPIVAVQTGGEVLLGRSVPHDVSTADEVVVLSASANPRDVARAPSAAATAELRQPLGLLLDEISPLTSDRDAVILGWNDLAPGLASMLAATLTGDAVVRIAVDLRHPDIAAARRWAENEPRCTVVGWDRANSALTSRDIVGTAARAVVLSDMYREPQRSDATSILTMLQLRADAPTSPSGTQPADAALVGVICELADPASQVLINARDSEELLVREELVSMLLTQFASDPQLHPVLEALLLRGAWDWAHHPTA